MRKIIKLLFVSLILLIQTNSAFAQGEKSVLSSFGYIKSNALLSQSDWYKLDQQARKALNDGDLSQAETYWLEAVNKTESSQNFYPGLVNCLIGLSYLYHVKNNYGESDRIYELAMRHMEGLAGRSSPEFAKQLPDLAWLYVKHGKPDKAEHILKQAVKTNETVYGAKSRQFMDSLRAYAEFLNHENRSSEASLLELQVKKIEEHLTESQASNQTDSSSLNDGN